MLVVSFFLVAILETTVWYIVEHASGSSTMSRSFHAVIEKVLKAHELKLSLIKDQLQEAQETDKDAMTSTLIVEGEMMSFEIEELKIRLREREIEVRR